MPRRSYRRYVSPRYYYRPSYRVAYTPGVATTTWCSDSVVPDAYGRAVCSTNGALMVDSTGAVIYLH